MAQRGRNQMTNVWMPFRSYVRRKNTQNPGNWRRARKKIQYGASREKIFFFKKRKILTGRDTEEGASSQRKVTTQSKSSTIRSTRIRNSTVRTVKPRLETTAPLEHAMKRDTLFNKLCDQQSHVIDDLLWRHDLHPLGPRTMITAHHVRHELPKKKGEIPELWR